MAQSLRELVATFGIRFDPTGAKKASHALDNLGRQAKGEVAGTMVQSAQAATSQTNVLANAIKGLGLVFAAQQVARGFGFIVTAASDAEDTINALQVTFGGSTDAVTDFASKTAKEIGRSEFVLRDYANRIGVLIGPAFQEMGAAGQEQAAEISNSFAALAVDLASFTPGKDQEEAITALRSGISGESEPLKQFGVDLTEAGIADALGINKKSLAKMNRAEKTMARYQAIMVQTKNAQGDAKRTGDDFVNLLPAMTDSFLDTAIILGRKFLPAAESLVRHLRDGIRWFGNLVKTSRIVESTLMVAAAAATFFGARAIWAARKTIKAWAKALWPFALIILILDDVWTTMEGGESVINDLLSWLTGVEGAGKIWMDAMQNMGAAIFDLVNGGGAALDGFVAAWLLGIDELWTGTVSIFDSILEYVTTLLTQLKNLIKDVFSFESISTGLDTIKDFFSGKGLSGAFDAAINATVGAVGGSVPTPTAAGGITNQSQTNFNMSFSGTGGPRETAREVEKVVRRAQNEDRRKVTNSVGGA